MKHFKDITVFLILTIYFLITIIYLRTAPTIYVNILKPIFWSCILIYSVWNIKENYVRFYNNRKYLLYMIIILSSHIILFFFIGFVIGFAKSPYNHEITSIIRNIIIQIIPTISIELLRALIITKNRNNKFVIALTTVLLLCIEIDYNFLNTIIQDKEIVFEYICSNILPLIAFNLLYTYLSLKVSYILPLLYRLSSKLLIILFPIFPNTDWFATGSINIILAVSIYALFKYVFLKDKKDTYRKKLNISSKISYSLTLSLCIALVCFMLGFFKYEPISILSNSMSPTFSRGDVVIYEKLDESTLTNLPIGTIIVYNINNKNIAHRIVNIVKENNCVFYQTQGDSNNTPDSNLVSITQILGIYSFRLKFIGFPSIWLYEYFNNETAKIETNKEVNLW